MYTEVINPVGKKVYIKFGDMHGKSGVVSEVHEIDGDTFYTVTGSMFTIVKKARNIVFMGNVE